MIGLQWPPGVRGAAKGLIMVWHGNLDSVGHENGLVQVDMQHQALEAALAGNVLLRQDAPRLEAAHVAPHQLRRGVAQPHERALARHEVRPAQRRQRRLLHAELSLHGALLLQQRHRGGSATSGPLQPAGSDGSTDLFPARILIFEPSRVHAALLPVRYRPASDASSPGSHPDRRRLDDRVHPDSTSATCDSTREVLWRVRGRQGCR